MIRLEKFPQDAFSGPGQVKDSSVIVTVNEIFIDSSSQKRAILAFSTTAAAPY